MHFLATCQSIHVGTGHLTFIKCIYRSFHFVNTNTRRWERITANHSPQKNSSLRVHSERNSSLLWKCPSNVTYILLIKCLTLSLSMAWTFLNFEFYPDHYWRNKKLLRALTLSKICRYVIRGHHKLRHEARSMSDHLSDDIYDGHSVLYWFWDIDLSVCLSIRGIFTKATELGLERTVCLFQT